MHDTAHFRGRDEDAVFKALDPEEAVASPIGAYRPLDGAAGLGSYRIRLTAATVVPASALGSAGTPTTTSCRRAPTRSSPGATAASPAALSSVRAFWPSCTRCLGLAATPP